VKSAARPNTTAQHEARPARVAAVLARAATAVVLFCPLVFASGCATATPQPAASRAGAASQAPPPRAPFRDDQHDIRKQAKSWLDLRNENVVMQQRDYSCGAAALATVIKHHWGDPVTETKVLLEVVRMLTPEELQERVRNGLSLTDLRRVAVRMGYEATIGRVEFSNLRESKIPLVVGIVVNDFDHFVVFRGTDIEYVYLADPARGNVRTPIAEFQQQWQRNLVLVVVKPEVDPKRESPLKVRAEEKTQGETSRAYLRGRLTSP
jgi:hypothetical protein